MTKQLQKLVTILQQKSNELNLFSAGDREKLESKHIPDSLAVMDFWKPKDGVQVLDLGSGGGIPALPLAISYPKVNFTLSDARQKKMDAMYDIKRELELENVTVVSGRFEELAHMPDFREKFDFVTARAVAPLPVLLEYAAGFLKPGGRLLAWKGPASENELLASKAARGQLYMDFVEAHQYELPTEGARSILIFEKSAKLPDQFPRRDGVPKAKPL